MNRAILIAVCLVFVGCGHLTVAPKLVTPSSVAWDESVQNAGIIDCDKDGCIVTPNWMDKYRKLEAKFDHTIAADANIKPEGANYRISYEVFNNFAEMRAAERGP